MPLLATTPRAPLMGVLLFIAVFLTFQPALDAGFVWDDDDYVTENPNLRDFEGLINTWIAPETLPQYYPLVHTSYWIEYQLWGLKPAGYHIVNLLLHGFASLLLFLILRRLGIRCAALAALIFAIHPVQVESVVWVTERKNCLSIVFYFGSFLSWLSWWPLEAESPARKVRVYGLSLFLFFCALLSKTVTCSLPAAILILVWWKSGRVTRKHGKALLPFFVVGFGMAALTVWLETNHVLAKGVDWELSFIERILIASRAIWFYIISLIWPFDLSFNYVRWVVDSASIWQWGIFGAFALLVSGLFFGRRKLGRGPIAGVLLFAGTLLPALGFVDVYPMRYSFVADHFQYLATPFMIVLLLELTSRSLGRARRSAQKIAPIAIVLVLLTLGFLTYNKSQSFRDLRALWTDTIENNPTSWLALLNLGVIELNEGHLDVAGRLLERSLALKSDDSDIHNNLGIFYFQRKDLNRALTHMREAQSLRPQSPQIAHNLAVILWDKGEHKSALAMVRGVLLIQPHYLDAQATLGRFLVEEEKFVDALNMLRHVLERRPNDSSSRRSLAQALAATGDHEKALRHLSLILQVEPENDLARGQVAACLRALGKSALANGQLFHILRNNVQSRSSLGRLVTSLAGNTRSNAMDQIDKFLVIDGPTTLIVVEALANQLSSTAGRRIAAKMFFDKARDIATDLGDSSALQRLRPQ